MRLFDDVNNFEKLIVKAKQGQILSEIKGRMLDFSNSEELNHQIIDWLNVLFSEYNEKAKSNTKTNELDNIIYNVINECIPHVSMECRLVLLTNLCILSDDDGNSVLHTLFLKNINRANYDVDKLLQFGKNGITESVNNTLLTCLGRLNFRAHNYSNAQKYLRICTNNLEALIEERAATVEQKLQYISSKIFLASCLEYQASIDAIEKRKETLSSAITELLGFECSVLEKTVSEKNIEIANDIKLFYSNNHYIALNKRERYTNVIDFINKLNFNETKIKSVISHSVSAGFDDYYSETIRNEYIHVLAHCISEYAVVLREQEGTPYPLCSMLQMLSRFFLDWLVVQGNDDYVTCQATVRAENDATPEAIELLLKQISLKNNLENENEKRQYAELEFFIFYFSEQELRLAYDNEQMMKIFDKYRNNFLEYASTEADSENFDPLFHYYIVYFRYLLKQAANNIIINSSNESFNSLNFEINKTYNELITVASKISGHVLKPVRDELDRLKKLYSLYNQIKNINSNYTLSNESSKEFESLLYYYNPRLFENKDSANIDHCEEMKKLYNEMVEPKNILLLAPVPNAPSCSFGIKNIDQLIPLNSNLESNNPIDFSGFIEEQSRKLDQVRIDQSITISIDKKVEQYFKWAIYFDSSKLFIFYSDFSLSNERRMFPVILNDDEHKNCLAIFQNLKKSLDSRRSKRCKYPLGDCKNNLLDVCYSTIILSENKELYNELLNILVFLEFDFQSYNIETKSYIPRIESDDIIIVYHKRRETEYRIIGFSQFDIKSVRDQICNICKFMHPERDNLSINSANNTASTNNVTPCQKVNFKKAHYELSYRLSNINDPSAQLYQELNGLKEIVHKCETAPTCPYPNEKTNHNCKLLDKLRENKIEGVFGKEFEG